MTARLLTAKEAAEYLGVSQKTLSRMRIPAVELRTVTTRRRPILRYEVEQLEKFIADSRTYTPETAA